MRRYSHTPGFMSIQILGLVFLGLIASILCVDLGFSYTVQNQLQTNVDAGALSAANKLWNSSAPTAGGRQMEAVADAIDLIQQNFRGMNDYVLQSQDVVFGFVDPQVKMANTNFTNFSADNDYGTTGGYNAVQVTLRKTDTSSNGQIPTFIGRLIGINGVSTQASSIAMLDNQIAKVTEGVRPIYGCMAQYRIANDSFKNGLGNPHFRIYGDAFYQEPFTAQGGTPVAGCPTPGSGNWGFADLRNCSSNSPGVPPVADWFLNGFPGEVSVENCYSTKPGNFISAGAVSNALDQLIANKTVITIPLVEENNFIGQGSDTHVQPTAFSGFVITGYEAHGAEDSRYIEGYFTKAICKAPTCVVGSGAQGGGVANLRLVGRL